MVVVGGLESVGGDGGLWGIGDVCGGKKLGW